MAKSITQEDIVNKKFQPTKFREGYDQEEVDDFLDEVARSFGELSQEAEELRDKLSVADEEASRLRQVVADLEEQLNELSQEQEHQEESESLEQVEEITEDEPSITQEDIVRGEVAPLLAMAQQVSATTIAQAEEEREVRLSRAIAEAQELAARGQQEYEAVMSRLASDKDSQEQEIARLKSLNEEYRTNLREALSSMLQNVESGSATTSS